jgi:hypothetical protein
MAQYKKYRIAQVCSNDTLIPDGGVGISVASLSKLFIRNDCQVDIITDIRPSNGKRQRFQEQLEGLGCRIVRAPDNISYTRYSRTHQMNWGIQSEESANMRESMMCALHTAVYDLVIIHSVNSTPGIYSLDLWKWIPTIIYTHDPNAIFKYKQQLRYSQGAQNFSDILYRLPGLLIGTHTEHNRTCIDLPQVRVLPLPLTTDLLLQDYTGPREGVLFIGKWEDRKNPALFCRVVAAAKLPARIITSPHSIDKFRREFAKLQHSDVTFIQDQHPESLRRGYPTAEEKTDFIQRCRVAYLPYLFETCPLAIQEAHCQMPVLLSSDAAAWHHNFTGAGIHKANKAEAMARLQQLHAQDQRCDWREEILQTQAHVEQVWMQQVGLRPGRASHCRAMHHPEMWHRDYISGLRRDLILDDIYALLNTQENRQRFHTATDCYYSESGMPPAAPDHETLDVTALRQWSRAL